MLLEMFDPDLNVHLLLGALLGLAFGVAAQISRFCLRRAVAGDAGPDGQALSVWLLALAVAVGGVQLAGLAGYIDLAGHRYLSADVPVLAIALGGLAFGAGMVLTRGCASRLTVLAASGNLRAWSVLVVFALFAHATLKGVFAPLAAWVRAPVVTLSSGGLSQWAGIGLALALLVAAVWLARQSRARILPLAMGAVIGLLVVAGWAGTSTLLFDDFDPAPVQSLAFTLPWSDGLFYSIASTALTPGFGVGLLTGVLIGGFASALVRKEIEVVSFSSPRETARYSAGGALMGVGGVLAGGCTIGAGLSGVSTLSFAAMLALGTIIVGAVATRHLLAPQTGHAVPAE